MLHVEWTSRLAELLNNGKEIGPRGKTTLEQLNVTLAFDSTYNLLDVPERKLNFRFAVAEWIWMMFGHSAVEELARYNSVMRQFSDDGVYLAGAYGPHIKAQLPGVLVKLKSDPASRQAVIEIPRVRRETKDNPCTLSLQFLLRDGNLNLIVNMRSSDVWLGVPYDAFTFSMVQNCVAGELHARRGWCAINMGSSHLYEVDFDRARAVLYHDGKLRTFDGHDATIRTPDLPGLPPYWLADVLETRSANGIPMKDGWPDYDQMGAWTPYAHALLARNSADARSFLKDMHDDAFSRRADL